MCVNVGKGYPQGTTDGVRSDAGFPPGLSYNQIILSLVSGTFIRLSMGFSLCPRTCAP